MFGLIDKKEPQKIQRTYTMYRTGSKFCPSKCMNVPLYSHTLRPGEARLSLFYPRYFSNGILSTSKEYPEEFERICKYEDLHKIHIVE